MLPNLDKARPSECLSDLVLDEWRAGEIEDQGRVSELEAHVAGCERCRVRREAFDQHAHSFLRRYPRPRFEALPSSRPKVRWARPFQVLAAVAVAAAAAFALVIRPPSESGTRTKGSSHVVFFVKRGERVFMGGPGERLQPGDRLRFTVTLARAHHLAIISRDARGVASVYYPAQGRTRALPAGTDVALENSVELDGTLGEEQLYAVFCDQAIAVEELRATLERTGHMAVGSGCTVDRSVFVKEPPR